MPAVLGLHLLVHLPYILLPLAGAHSWRQAETLAVARNFHRESWNILKPRVDERDERIGITAMEFPLYQAVVAAACGHAGRGWLLLSRIVSLASSLAALLLMAKMLARAHVEPRTAIVAVLFTVLSPLHFSLSAIPMPEMFALALCFGGLALLQNGFTNALQTGAAGVLFGLGILCRPQMIVFGAALLLPFLNDLRRRERRRLRGWIIFGLAALPAFLLWYLWWCPKLVHVYRLEVYYMGMPVVSALGSLLTIQTLRGSFFCLTQGVCNWMTLPLAAVGIAAAFGRARQRGDSHIHIPISVHDARSLLVLVLGGALGTLILLARIGDHFVIHKYSLIALVPLMAVAAAFGLDVVARSLPRGWVTAMLVLAAAVTAGNVVHTYRVKPEVALWEALAADARRVSKPADLFIVESDGSPILLYYMERKGWLAAQSCLEDVSFMQSVMARGARFVVRPKDDGPIAPYRVWRIEDYLAQMDPGLPDNRLE